jgi:hypothetical protein
MPLFLVTSVCDEGISPSNFRVVEAASRLAVAQHMLDRVFEWEPFLRPTTLWWELTYYPHKYGVPRGWSATDLLAEIDKTWVDGDSTNQLRIHEIGTIVHLSAGKEPDKPVIMEMRHSATERTD